MLEQVLPLGLAKRDAFFELLALAHYLGHRIAEAPIEMKFREKHGSGVSFVRSFTANLLWDDDLAPPAPMWCAGATILTSA